MGDNFFVESIINTRVFDFCLLFTIKKPTLKKILNQSGDVVEC